MTDSLFSNPPAEVTSPKPARQVYAPEFSGSFTGPFTTDDDLQAAADDERDRRLIDQLVDNEDMPFDWRPDPKDLC